MVTTEDISWRNFETTGSIEAYLEYSREKSKSESKEETAFGNSGNGGDSDQRGQIW